MTPVVASDRFSYGNHKIPLGKAYAYRFENDNTVNLYCFGGMGLEASKINEVTFQFPAETAEKAEQIVKQIFAFTGPVKAGSYYDKAARLMRKFTSNEAAKAYQITAEKVLKASGVFKHSTVDGSMGGAGTITTKEKYIYGVDLMQSVDVNLEELEQGLKGAQERIKVFLEKRPDLSQHFGPFIQQASRVLSSGKPSPFEVEILINSLEIMELKYRLGPPEWDAFQSYIFLGTESLERALKLAPPAPKN